MTQKQNANESASNLSYLNVDTQTAAEIGSVIAEAKELRSREGAIDFCQRRHAAYLKSKTNQKATKKAIREWAESSGCTGFIEGTVNDLESLGLINKNPYNSDDRVMIWGLLPNANKPGWSIGPIFSTEKSL